MKKVKFVYNNLWENGWTLARHFNLNSLKDVPVDRYIIRVKGKIRAAIKKEDQRPEVASLFALMMLYLTEGQGDKVFDITPTKKRWVKDYFGPNFCEDTKIMSDRETQYLAVRLLLQKGAQISVYLEPNH